MTEHSNAKKIFRIIGFGLAALMVVAQGVLIGFNAIALRNSSLLLFLREHRIISLIINYACIYGLGFIIYRLIIRKLPHALPADKEFSFKELFQFFCIGYALAISSNLIATILTLITGDKTNVSTAITGMVTNGGVVAAIIMIIVAPAIEELIFRKFIIDRTKRFGEKYAIVFSAICFGLFHMNLQQFLYAAAIGLVFGYVYSRSGRIQYTMIMHSIINAIGYLLALVASPVLESMGDIDISSIINGGSPPSMNIDIPSVLIMLLAEQVIMAIIVMGIIFFIIKVHRVRFDYSSPDCLGKGKVFKTIYLNIGVILFVLICIAGIVISFMGGIESLIK